MISAKERCEIESAHEFEVAGNTPEIVLYCVRCGLIVREPQ